MALNRRPIVYYEALRRKRYDQQVAEIMAAKTDYILYANPDEAVVSQPETAKQAEPAQSTHTPVEPEVLRPHVQTTSEQKELTGLEEQPDVQSEGEELATADSDQITSVTAVELEPQKKAVLPDHEAQAEELVSDEVQAKPAEKQTKHSENMTGLGLSLDTIFGEENQAARKIQSNYFKDSK
ncbi:hypothetical protein JOC36_001067 [Weissella uvarum]|uniref:hypothetical protein n=1 Tax=Weissella uvarum TaxID=1479233 RepID=UPI0019608322|nr:hypothetical protein [Weissella uvarum]MBM7617510.1 hypothetical protein [Weissella uvarum]MCM0595606.1 hypothetical protein [Weissella uvarum]